MRLASPVEALLWVLHTAQEKHNLSCRLKRRPDGWQDRLVSVQLIFWKMTRRTTMCG